MLSYKFIILRGLRPMSFYPQKHYRNKNPVLQNKPISIILFKLVDILQPALTSVFNILTLNFLKKFNINLKNKSYTNGQ